MNPAFRSLLKLAAGVWLVGWAVFGIPWGTFTARPQRERMIFVPFRQYSYRRRDLALNLIYYGPLGLIGIGLGWGVAGTTLAAIGLSGLTELVQIFSTDRYPSSTDVVLNTGGAIIGSLAALWLRRFRRS